MKNINLNKEPTRFSTTTPRSLFTTARSDTGLCASCSIPEKPETETIKTTSVEIPTEIPPPFKVVTKDESTTSEPSTEIDALPQKLINPSLKAGNVDAIAGRDLVKGPSSFTGLPQNLNRPKMFNKNAGNTYSKAENLMNGILYKFNYDTDFQAHREQGDRLGNKEGEYYSVGPDNIKTVVSYKANEFGFMPFIRREPAENRYYNERNSKLRNYNFQWFY